MKFTFETSGNNTFLVYKIGQEDTVDTMSLGMITNNRIPGLVSVLYTQKNRERFLKYNVTARVTAKQFFSGVINRKRLIGILLGVTDALMAAEEYMIDASSLLLDMDYIYVNVSTCTAETICLPLIRKTEAADCGMFFKNIMFTTQFDQTEDCGYVAGIINYLNGTPVFVPEDFHKLLQELQQGTAAHASSMKVQEPLIRTASAVQAQSAAQLTPRNAPGSEPQPALKAQEPPQSVTDSKAKTKRESEIRAGFAVSGREETSGFAVPGKDTVQQDGSQPTSTPQTDKEMSLLYLLQHYNKENAAAYKAQKAVKKKGTPQVQQPIVQTPPRIQQSIVQTPPRMSSAGDDFGDTVVMGAMDMGTDTVVLEGSMAASAVKPYLYRARNGERIMLEKPVFRLGKERNYVDYCISGNPTISRSHADIICRNGQYYIMDNNSTNHTYVNGELIPSNTEVLLTHGAKIRLSDEEFEFMTF